MVQNRKHDQQVVPHPPTPIVDMTIDCLVNAYLIMVKPQLERVVSRRIASTDTMGLCSPFSPMALNKYKMKEYKINNKI